MLQLEGHPVLTGLVCLAVAAAIFLVGGFLTRRK